MRITLNPIEKSVLASCLDMTCEEIVLDLDVIYDPPQVHSALSWLQRSSLIDATEHGLLRRYHTFARTALGEHVLAEQRRREQPSFEAASARTRREAHRRTLHAVR